MNDLKIIARIECDFTTKFGIPRQSGLVDSVAKIVFEPEFRNSDALRGLNDFLYIWLIWGFSENARADWSPTVRPPRLGGNDRMGVFATRSPFRPNPIGLSSVRLLSIDFEPMRGHVLIVSGADLMNGTPIYDIKPYLPITDVHCDATSGFAGRFTNYSLEVEISDTLYNVLPKNKMKTLIEILKQDPRPAYHHDSNRIYGFEYSGYEVRFSVSDSTLNVVSIDKIYE